MKFCVIGLGRFGKQVATVLSEHGAEVMAIDSNQALVAAVRDSVTEAICMRITDEASLRNIGVNEMHTVIVAIGESFAQSVLITALLKKRLNIPQVVARAIDSVHYDVLLLVGADRVVLPEQEIGTRVADNLSSPFIDFMRLSKNFSIGQVIVPDAFIGKSVSEIEVSKKYEIQVIGRKDENEITALHADDILHQDDQLVVAGTNKNLERFIRM